MTIDTKKLAALEGVDAEGLDAPPESAAQAATQTEPLAPAADPTAELQRKCMAGRIAGDTPNEIAARLGVTRERVLDLTEPSPRPQLRRYGNATVFGNSCATVVGGRETRKL